jgi:MoxR-like ATPase
MGPEQIMAIQRLVREVEVSDTVNEYAVRLVRSTRPTDESAGSEIRRFVSFGAGPRATQFLVLGAKARAVLNGHPVPSIDDVRAVAPAVLRHRILLNFLAESESVRTDDLIAQLLNRR